MALKVIGACMVVLILVLGLGQHCAAARAGPVSLFEPKPGAVASGVGAPGVKKSDVIGVTVVSSKPQVLLQAPRKLKLYLSKKVTVTATRKGAADKGVYGDTTMWIGEVDGFKGGSSIVSLSTNGKSMSGVVRWVDLKKNKVHKFQVSPIKGGRMTAIAEVKEVQRSRDGHKAIPGFQG